MESDLVRSWLEKLRKLGAWAERSSAYDLTTGRGNMRLGFPDLVIIYKGVPIFVEAKKSRLEWLKWLRNGSEQAPSQKRCIEELRQAGAIAFCCYRFSDIQIAIDEIDNGDEWRAGTYICNKIDVQQAEERQRK